MIYATVLFILAGLAEIGGGYLIWLWLREGKPFYWGLFGGIALALYGVIATFQSFPSFGRVYVPTEEYLSFFLYCGDGELIKKHLIYTIG
jgi:drug/metabolite transporter superfamily protein YnfA